MSVRSKVVVIDSDAARRAAIAGALYSENYHVEICSSIEEFIGSPCEGGVMLIHDDRRDETLEVFSALETVARYLPVALYRASPDTADVVRAIKAGASDYLEWPAEIEVLNQAIEKLEQKARERGAVEQRRMQARRLVAGLTKRQSAILNCVVQGMSNKQTGLELGISHRTVEVLRQNVSRKLEANGTADLVRMAIYAGFDQAGRDN
jgi:two-component system response regulator FixJ